MYLFSPTSVKVVGDIVFFTKNEKNYGYFIK